MSAAVHLVGNRARVISYGPSFSPDLKSCTIVRTGEAVEVGYTLLLA